MRQKVRDARTQRKRSASRPRRHAVARAHDAAERAPARRGCRPRERCCGRGSRRLRARDVHRVDELAPALPNHAHGQRWPPARRRPARQPGEARAACATTARPRRAPARVRPAPPPAGHRASAERCAGAHARTARARRRAARCPSHHRRQANDELLDRRRKPRRARRMVEAIRVALQRVHPRLQTIVTGRPTTARPPRAAEQGGHDEPPRFRRQRLARWPIPATAAKCRRTIQRHRQRPTALRKQARRRARADARGAAGETLGTRRRRSARAGRNWPQSRGWRSVRCAATVGRQCICRSSRSCEREPRTKTGRLPGLCRSF
jgi:hypothetical protein